MNTNNGAQLEITQQAQGAEEEEEEEQHKRPKDQQEGDLTDCGCNASWLPFYLFFLFRLLLSKSRVTSKAFSSECCVK